MKKNFSNLYLFLPAVALAGGIGYYWHTTGLEDTLVLNAAAAVFIAAASMRVPGPECPMNDPLRKRY